MIRIEKSTHGLIIFPPKFFPPPRWTGLWTLAELSESFLATGDGARSCFPMRTRSCFSGEASSSSSSEDSSDDSSEATSDVLNINIRQFMFS